jgi:hypothetical protein
VNVAVVEQKATPITDAISFFGKCVFVFRYRLKRL